MPSSSFYDVAADLGLPKRGLELRREPPRTCPHLLREAETFEHLQASELLPPELPSCRRPRKSPVDGHEPTGSSVADECPVDVREVEPLDRLPARLHDLALRAVAQRLGREVLAAPADTLPKVIGMDPEALAWGVPTADQNMHVRVTGVVVVDGHPLEARAEIPLHVRDECSCVRLQVEALSVLRRDDELPQPFVARPLPAPQRRRKLDAVLLRAEATALPALTLGALPRQVRAVRSPRSAPAVPRVGRLHGAPLPARIHAAEERAAAAQTASAQTTAPPTATCMSWDGRTMTPVARA